MALVWTAAAIGGGALPDHDGPGEPEPEVTAAPGENPTADEWIVAIAAGKKGTWSCHVSPSGACTRPGCDQQIKAKYEGTKDDSSTVRRMIRKKCEDQCESGTGGKCVCKHDGCFFKD